MSKGLKALDNLVQSCFNSCDSDEVLNDKAIVEKELRALEIIKNKPQAELSLIQLGKIKTYEEYLKYTKHWDLEYWNMIYEEEEFNLLKEVLE